MTEPVPDPEGPLPASAPRSRRTRALAAADLVFARLAQQQVRHPWKILLIVMLVAAVGVVLARRLDLRTSLGELLPRNKESVIVAEQVNERLPAMSSLTVVGEGRDNEALKRFVDALVPELVKIDPDLVGSVDRGVQASQAFLQQNRMLYAPLDLVQQVHDEIVDRYDYEVARQLGTALEEEEPPAKLTEESIKSRIEQRAKSVAKERQDPKFPDGYYLDEQKHIIAVRILTPIGSGDLDRTEQLKSAVKAAVDRVDPKRFDPTLRVGLSGNLLTGAETYGQIKDDLTHVGVWGVSAVLFVTWLFYLRLRTLIAMALTVGVGSCVTFGVAYLTIGHLNTSTGFLFSIVVGNGINFGIIYMARYFEARRDSDPQSALLTAHIETWIPTLTAAAAGSAAYGALAITNFRGFKHFGVIGGTGMLFCWLSTYVFLPVILVLYERWRPMRPSHGIAAKIAGFYGRPFAYLATHVAGVVVIGAVLVTVLSLGLAYRYLKTDPMEYNMSTIDNAPPEKPTEVRRLSRLTQPILGRLRQDGVAIAVDRVDQVMPLKHALDERLGAAPVRKKPFDSVVTIFSLIPEDQDKKIELINDARSTLEHARKRGFIKDADWKKIEELFPPKLHSIGIEDLPEQMAQPFMEKDGARGRLVYIVPRNDESVWDGRYLIRWAESFRTTELPDGSVIKGSGRSVIFADMILAIVEDAPRAIIASLLTTLFIVAASFRDRRASAWVVGSILVGLIWTVGILSIWKTTWPWQHGKFVLEGMKLNFLNFVALPITLGVGSDYAVNVMQRYRLAGEDMRRVIIETGGAVVLCSLTTTTGYLALTLSINGAIRSFGIAAATGEICCVLTGVLVLPACLVLLSGRHSKAAPAVRGPRTVTAPRA